MLAIGIVACGCKHDTINFYRESSASKLMRSMNNDKARIQPGSGIIILHDNPSGLNINFGPKDINFDMPARIK